MSAAAPTTTATTARTDPPTSGSAAATTQPAATIPALDAPIDPDIVLFPSHALIRATVPGAADLDGIYLLVESADALGAPSTAGAPARIEAFERVSLGWVAEVIFDPPPIPDGTTAHVVEVTAPNSNSPWTQGQSFGVQPSFAIPVCLQNLGTQCQYVTGVLASANGP